MSKKDSSPSTSTSDSATSIRKADLYDELDQLSAVAERRFRKRLKNARSARALEAINNDLQDAKAEQATRIAAIPSITYPPQLPVTDSVERISSAIKNNQVVIIAGETGSGKTTQIPKICLDLGRGRRGLIGHTQPRRLAARTVAERIAEELDQKIGDTVGYSIRFDDSISATSTVKLMTDGILLAEMQRDRLLLAYDTIIIDEAHERSLNIDFILGYLKQLLPQRPDLKVIITSATIDPERFAHHFSDSEGKPAPIIEVSGRTYPVEIRYRPPWIEQEKEDGSVKRIELDPLDVLCQACEELLGEGDGDILCFFSGEREIRDAAEAIEAQQWRNVEVTPLFGRLSNAEQHRVFSAHSGRRIVLATNIAETSLTVPGIRYVVDTGTARISRYSARTKVQRLPVEPISKASANQRSGRCGRVAEGIAIRLYSQEDFDSRDDYTDPEILRTNLASVIVQMAALKLGDITQFPFIDPPDSRAIRDGMMVLHELGAIDSSESHNQPVLTRVGSQIARIPVDPRLARILIEAHNRGVVEVAAVIVAALSLQDIKERPTEFAAQADQLHARFKEPSSDFLTSLGLWAYLTYQRSHLSGNAFRKLCKAEYLHYMRSREWMDLVRQLRSIVQQLDWEWDHDHLEPHVEENNDDPAANRGAWMKNLPTITVDSDALHQSVLAGMLSHIGMRDDKSHRFKGARGVTFASHPGSAVAKKPPSWVVASEIVETSQMFARDVATISPRWIEQQAGFLLKHSYSEPHWSTKRQTAMAYQKSTLFGLPVVSDRLVNFNRIDPDYARELFIRHALVQGEWTTHHSFFHENMKKLDAASHIEDKARRRDLVIDDEALFQFYDARVPKDVSSARDFDSWWKKTRRSKPTLLDFDPEALVDPTASDIEEDDFPDRWVSARHGYVLDLAYKFEPQSPDDGVSVRIPLPILGSLDSSENFEWLVPGLRLELITALIKSLPKSMRTTVVPAPEYARKSLDLMVAYDRPLAVSLADALRQLGGSGMTASDFSFSSIASHLRMNFQAIDRHGKVIDQDRDLEALKDRLAGQATQAMSAALARAGHGSSGRGGGDQQFGGGKIGIGSNQDSVGSSSADDPPTSTSRKGKSSSSEVARGERPSSSGPGGGKNRGKGVPERRVFTEWTEDGLGSIEPQIEAVVDGQDTVAYPALTVTGKGIEVQTFGSRSTATAQMFTSELTLLLRAISVPTNPMVKGLPLTQKVAVDNYPHGGAQGLVEDCRTAAIRDAFIAAGGVVYSPREFEDRKSAVADEAKKNTRAMVVTMARNLVSYLEVKQALSGWTGDAIDDMNRQLDALVPAHAVTRYGIGHLRHLDRYLKAMLERLDSMETDPDRDAVRQDEVNSVEDYLAAKLERLPSGKVNSPEVRDILFMIQELRVSLFAQKLGTAQSVSAQRIRKAIDRLK